MTTGDVGDHTGERPNGIAHSAEAAADPPDARLRHWMRRVLAESRAAGEALSPDAVHDLRVALRRCRSMSKSVMELDSSREWRAMRKAGRKLFRALGALRDAHVMQVCVDALAPAGDPVRQRLAARLDDAERTGERDARDALRRFDRRAWKRFAAVLPPAARQALDDPLVAEHLALERYHEAWTLHRRAVTNRSRPAWHRLRVGLKRFRYTIENFLADRFPDVERDLKRCQNWLGEVRDLDVLWTTMQRAGVFADAAERAQWRTAIDAQRDRLLARYRAVTVGAGARWGAWRAGLPAGERLEAAVLSTLRAWASFHDPAVGDKAAVAALAGALLDGLAPGVSAAVKTPRARSLLHAAALLHDVGRTEGRRGRHKATARLIRALRPPVGWTAGDVQVLALVARYHRGAPPRMDHPEYAALAEPARAVVCTLAGVLRVALALARTPGTGIAGVTMSDDAIVVQVAGDEASARAAGRERWLLEAACGRAIVIRHDARPSSPG